MTFLISVMTLILLISDVNLLQFSRHQLHAHVSMPTFTDVLTDIVFSPVEQLQGPSHSFTVSKCLFKFGNLQIFCYYSNEKPLTGLWETIPHHLEDDFIANISAIKLRITSSGKKYVNTVISLNITYLI